MDLPLRLDKGEDYFDIRSKGGLAETSGVLRHLRGEGDIFTGHVKQ